MDRRVANRDCTAARKARDTLKLVPVNGHPNPGYPYISGPASAIMAVKGKPLTGTADARQPGAIRGY